MIPSDPSDKLIDEASKLAPKVYDDLAQPAAKEIGQVAGRTVKALLSPIRAMLWGWERIEKVVNEGMEKRLNNIPEENLKTPDPEIAVPALQALSYTAQNETLREMYLNLLANSMDSSKDKFVHPSFVELIKQMNSLDAKVFEKLNEQLGYINVVNPYLSLVGTNQNYVNALPEWFTGWVIPDYDIFEVSASIIRLGKFGIIELLFDRTTGGGTPPDHNLATHESLVTILQMYRTRMPNQEITITYTDSIIYVNEYGKQFKKACL